MTASAILRIREEVLRDPRYPVHKIADRLLPYLRVLVEQFQPIQIILFGSFANGMPDRDSDVDLLVVKDYASGRVREKVAIRSAWWPLLRSGDPLSFDLLLAKPEEIAADQVGSGMFHADILQHGLRLL